MPNSLAKTFTLIFLSFIFSVKHLYASPFASFSDYSFSVEPCAGFLWGQAAELVYLDEDSEQKASELLWNFKPLWYFGGHTEFAQKNYSKHFGFFSTLDVQCGIPLQTAGVMEDRDWLGPAGELTNYSRHDNRTNSFISVDLSSGLDIPTPLGSLLTFRLSTGISYMLFSWTPPMTAISCMEKYRETAISHWKTATLLCT